MRKSECLGHKIELARRGKQRIILFLLSFERSTHTHDVVNDRRHQIKEVKEEFGPMWEPRCFDRYAPGLSAVDDPGEQDRLCTFGARISEVTGH